MHVVYWPLEKREIKRSLEMRVIIVYIQNRQAGCWTQVCGSGIIFVLLRFHLICCRINDDT